MKDRIETKCKDCEWFIRTAWYFGQGVCAMTRIWEHEESGDGCKHFIRMENSDERPD